MKKILLSILGMLFLAQTAAFAIGSLFSRPLNSTTTYNKVWIKSVDATVQITGQVATTHVDQIFYNEMTATIEAVWIFPLPEGAVVTELYYWFNGQRYKGSVREAQKARNDYNNRIRQQLDPALLVYLGNNLFRLSIAPINGLSDVRTEITYVQLLPYEFGNVDYSFLLNATGLSPKPLNRISVSGVIESPTAFKYMRSPTYGNSTDFQLTQVTDKKFSFVFGDENYLPDRDLILEYETLRNQIQVNMLRYTPTPQDSIGTDSFYALWITPPDSLTSEEQIPKKIVFTADVSSSMEDARIQQLKACLQAFLNHLALMDQFNIIPFGTTVTPFRPNLVSASAANLDSARAFITDLGAAGLTNIDEALSVSLLQSFSDETVNSIVFLTDGYPTWGETSAPKILSNVQTRNVKKVKIFPFGVGDDVSKPLLTQLGSENGGYATFIANTTDIAGTISNHFKRMSRPVLTNLALELTGLTTSDKFPRPLPDLFWGSQVLQLGLYSNAANALVTLKAQVRGQPLQMQAEMNFETTPGGYSFVPRLWAQAKINYLLEQIGIYGEIAELKNQIIELSLKFQILTPYTAFYSDPNDPASEVVIKADEQLPFRFTLAQNYPNPFNPTTAISYQLPGSGTVRIKIFDLQGRLVKTLFSGSQQAGAYTVCWDGRDMHDRPVAAGVYLYQIEFVDAGGKKTIQSKKMSLVK